MSKKFLFITLGVVVAGVAAFFLLTGSSKKHLRFIPSDAFFVLSFDLKKLADKSDFNGKLKETKLFKKFMENGKRSNREDVDRFVLEIIKDPEASGLDLQSNMYYFFHGKDKDMATGLVIGMRDLDKFEKFLKRIPGMDKKIQNKKTHYVFFDESHCFAWNQYGLLRIARPADYYDEKKDGTIDLLNRLMIQDQDKSVQQNKEFKKCISGKGDIECFINYGELMNNYKGMRYRNEMMDKMMENFKGIYIGARVSFENDRIVFSSETHGDEKAIEKVNYLNKNGVDGKVLKFITNDKVYALTSASLDIPKIIALFGEDKAMRQQMESGMQGLGMTLKEFESVFNGDLVFSLVDIKEMPVKSLDYRMNEATGQYEMVQEMRMQPMPVFTVNIGVKDRNAYNKLMKNIPVPPVDGMRIFPIPYLYTNVFAVESEYGMTLTNDSATAATIVANKKMIKEPNNEIAGLMTGKPMAAYFNLDLKSYPPVVSENLKKAWTEEGFSHFATYISLFSDVKGSGDFKHSDLEINLVKGEGNSLFRLLKQTDKLPIDEL